MPSSVITVSVGQCGNQIGSEFWKTMCLDHGIGADGMLTTEDQPGMDRKDMFFYEAEPNGRYVPRSVLIDLEPRVINTILTSELQQLHNAANLFHSSDGSGAGNNWAIGYNQPKKVIDGVFEILDREAENADYLEGFILTHSISGGTGSGLGSKIIEQIKERYPKTVLQTYSVFADPKEASDVIVTPYNSVLTLDWLIEHPDIVVFLDNSALYRVASEAMRVPTPSFDHINSMTAKIMTGFTAPMRFYSPVYTRLVHAVAQMNPFPPMHFIQTAYAPFVPSDSKFVSSTSTTKILSRILDPKLMISSAGSVPKEKVPAEKPSEKPSVKHCMLSAMAILQTDELDFATDIGLRQKTQKRKIEFAPWSSSALNITNCRLSPYIDHKHHASGLLLANHTNISSVFGQITGHYDRMHKRGANLHQYEKQGLDTLEQMKKSRERVSQLVSLYEEATTMRFVEEVRSVTDLDLSTASDSTRTKDASPCA